MSLVHTLETLLQGVNERLDWDSYFHCLSLLISSRSACHRLHVGCVLVRDHRVLATGYNGFLVNAPHRSIVRDDHEQATVHAEQNAITHAARAGIALDGAVAYITHYPCINCCKILLAAGIREIRYIHDYHNDSIVEILCGQVGATLIKFQDSVRV